MHVFRINDRVMHTPSGRLGTVSYAGAEKCQIVWDAARPTSFVAANEIFPIAHDRWVQHLAQREIDVAEAFAAL